MSMEKLFITPKWKSSYCSDLEPSPEDKRLKESNSPAKTSCDKDEVVEALGSKIDLVLSTLSNLETKMEELNIAVKGLQSKVMSLEIEVGSVEMITSLHWNKILYSLTSKYKN